MLLSKGCSELQDHEHADCRLGSKQFEHCCNVDLTKFKSASSTLQCGHAKHMRKPNRVGSTTRITI
eukprot:1224526-Karenia_brevis.AAC.1